MALFARSDLAAFLQQDVDNATTDVMLRVASGWLMSVTSPGTWTPDWPNPVPDNLFGWALELAGIAYRNPDGTATESIDDYSRSADRARRAEILKQAASVFGGSSGPQYSFPDVDWHWSIVPILPPATPLTF